MPGSICRLWNDALESGRKVTLPHHAREMAEGTLRAILRELESTWIDFSASGRPVNCFASGMSAVNRTPHYVPNSIAAEDIFIKA
jgi:hypothetical protein